MPFSDAERLYISQKMALGLSNSAGALPGRKEYYEEDFPFSLVVNSRRIWNDFALIPGALNYGAADANVIALPLLLEKRTIRLTIDPTSNGRFYTARTIWGDNTSPVYDNWILPALIRINGQSSVGYSMRLYNGDPGAGGTIISPVYHSVAGQVCWTTGYSEGLLFVSTDEGANFQAIDAAAGLWFVGYRYIGATGGGSGTGGVAVYYNGTLLDATITELNFEGVGLSVEDTIVGQRATIYVPPMVYSPFYNVGGAAVPNIATSNRFVAAPTIEGTPYKIGGWVGGTSHACVNTGAWNYTAAGACSFKTDTTTIEATLFDADGVTPLATHLTAPIAGNIDVTVNNIRIQVTGWAAEGSRYKGTIIVDYTTSAIIPPGGRSSVSIIHHNAGTDYTKTQNDIFYDINNNAASLLGGVTTIAETGGSVVTRFISGVEYYDLGSQFTIDVTDIDYINCNSYPATVLDCDGTEYGLPPLNLGVASLTGWTNLWDDIDDSYQNVAWAITAANFFSLSTTANVSARTEDWAAGAWQNSANANIAIETHNTANTDTIERFYYENYRCALVGPNFDLANQKAWTSNIDILPADACFYNGGCERNVTNFTIYNPNPGSQPDYSASQNATVYLIREFITDGAAHANARINISGTYTSLEVKMAKAWDGLASGGSVWMNCLAAYNAGNFNYGDPTGGSGCQTGTGAGYVDITFGSQNLINTSNTCYLRIGFTAGQRITGPLSMVFS